MPKVSDLTLHELEDLIEQTVEKRLMELFHDPDKSFELRQEVKARLWRTLRRERRGLKGIPAAEVAKHLGLEW